MARIALLGYGKMGQAAADAARARGHEIVLTVGSAQRPTLTLDDLRKADVVIEVSRPESAVENIMLCLEAGVPVVCGTTGWTDRMAEVIEYCNARNGAFLFASNFSIGVNIVFEINRRLAAAMSQQTGYTPLIHETHHVHKRDAPSGTAITLAEGILAEVDRFKQWQLQTNQPLDSHSLPIIADRIDEVPGTHEIQWNSPQDSIILTHQAHNRSGFAAGAALAAEFLAGKKGVFTMKDVLFRG